MATYHHGDLRPALLRAAAKILEKEGREAISLRDLARRAGVSHNAPYRHFADRGALLAVLADEGFVRLVGELRPSTRTSFRRGRFRLTVTNQGNSSARVRVQATDTAELLQIAVDPPVLVVAPGESAIASIRAGLVPIAGLLTHRTTLADVVKDLPQWSDDKRGLIKALVEVD